MARVPLYRYTQLYYPALVLLSIYLVYVHLRPSLQLRSTPRPHRHDKTRPPTPAISHPNLIFAPDRLKLYIHPRLNGTTGSRRQPFLVVLVCSSPAHRDLRDSIRYTWADPGRTDIIRRGVVKVFFVLGRVGQDSVISKDLENEGKIHGDIIGYDSPDGAERLTLKTLYGLMWIQEKYSSPKFIMKCDDDVFINIKAMVQELHANTLRRVSNTILGHVIQNAKPKHLSRDSQWFDDNNSFRRYPDYASGSGYVMSGDVMAAILSTAQRQSVYINQATTLEYNKGNAVVRMEGEGGNKEQVVGNEAEKGNGDTEEQGKDDLSMVDTVIGGKDMPNNMINNIVEGKIKNGLQSKSSEQNIDGNVINHVVKLLESKGKDKFVNHMEHTMVRMRINNANNDKSITQNNVEIPRRDQNGLQPTPRGLFWLEDICITGILFTGSLIHNSKFMVDVKGTSNICDAFSVHRVDIDLMKELWASRNGVNCQ